MTIIKTNELLIYIRNVCAYTLWSVLEINTSFRRHWRLEEDQLDQCSDWGNTSSPLLFSFFSRFRFFGPSRPDLVMHRMDDVDMQFLGVVWLADVDAGWYDISGELLWFPSPKTEINLKTLILNKGLQYLVKMITNGLDSLWNLHV